MTYEFMPPAPEGGELIHTRRYEVRTYKLNDDRFLLRGVLCDEKPGGLYLAEDDEELWVHHMVVDLEVSYPAFRIESAHVQMKEHPHTRCTNIIPAYDGLVGLSIARGFNNKIREMFGGPRGCTHIGALLSAMAPVAIQSGWSMRARNSTGKKRSEMTPEERERGHAMNLNTCHMWDENGDMMNEIRRGEPMEIPVWMRKRLVKLGKNPDEWQGWD